MCALTLKKAAQWMNATLQGEDKLFTGICIDSRHIAENQLFFALEGTKWDGHDFMQEAKEKQAAGVVVSKAVPCPLPQLKVADTRLALGNLAKEYRLQFKAPLAAITGSYGKTTVKEMLASILSKEGPVLATQGNLNTDIGVPLTLMQLKSEHRYAVIEMGARKKGDIHYLTHISSPDVALITNAGIAHIEIFGSEEEVKEAKGELFATLSPHSIAVLSIDDPHFDYWKTLLKDQRIFTFGTGHPAEVGLSSMHLYANHATFKLQYQTKAVSITLKAAGEHNVRNALAAAAMALAMGASLEAVQLGLMGFEPVQGRLQFKTGVSNIKIIDDTYNANPISMRAALGVLAAQPGEKFFVMGDMLELGKYAKTWHEDIGEEAKRLGIHRMFGFGQFTKEAILKFGEKGGHYDEKKALIQALKEALEHKTEVTILVKGSRGMKMEEIVLALQHSNTV